MMSFEMEKYINNYVMCLIDAVRDSVSGSVDDLGEGGLSDGLTNDWS